VQRRSEAIKAMINKIRTVEKLNNILENVEKSE
jgi:hypothetical protein